TVGQSSYQAEENQNISLDWTFTRPDPFRIILYRLFEGDEVPQSEDKQFSGRVQSDRDVLREGRLRLHVSRLRTEDSGLYECDVITDQGGGSDRCNLTVSGELKSFQSSSDLLSPPQSSSVLLSPPQSSSVPLRPPQSSSVPLRPPQSSSDLLSPPKSSSDLLSPPQSPSDLLSPPQTSSVLPRPPQSSTDLLKEDTSLHVLLSRVSLSECPLREKRSGHHCGPSTTQIHLESATSFSSVNT
uniref:Immunoglobulin domain-containing protein n=1 Tax=Echeneis naucrates TaxID=173247 RepID=A0A665TN52_ECHNA